MASTTVIVGASVSGVRVAQSLRTAGYEGDVVLVSDEDHAPYDKPPLSKALLAGTSTADDIALWTSDDVVAAGVTLRNGQRADALDTAAREVVLASGERMAFDDLVVATGATARPSPWGTPEGLHLLRTLDDARALRADLLADTSNAGHVAVIGGGFIGAEVAATARGMGLEVSMIDPLTVPLSKSLGTEIGKLVGDLHTAHGVNTRFGVGVEGIEGTRPELRVHLNDGDVLEASTVVVGIGAIPNDGWLASSGLSLGDGVVCDEFGRASATENVWAVGDVARWWHPRHGEHTRVEHWTGAVEQARVVARHIAHPDDLVPHTPVEYVWSDQYDRRIQIVGRPAGDTVLIGDPADRFAALYGSGELAGVVTVNWPKAALLARRAFADGLPRDELRRMLEP